MSQPRRNGRSAGGWWFLLLVLLAYAVVGVGEPDVAHRALATFGKLFVGLVPALLLVFAFMLVLNWAFEGKENLPELGSRAGVREWVLAIAAGVLSVGPLYPWYGLLAQLRARGIHSGLIAAFLYARAIKLPLLPLMVHYFGLAYTVVLSLVLLTFSLVSGWIVGRLTPQD